MKKEYMKPVIEVIESQLDLEMMTGHSDDWADSKENFVFDDFEDEGIDSWSNQSTVWKEDMISNEKSKKKSDFDF